MTVMGWWVRLVAGLRFQEAAMTCGLVPSASKVIFAPEIGVFSWWPWAWLWSLMGLVIAGSSEETFSSPYFETWMKQPLPMRDREGCTWSTTLLGAPQWL